MDSNSQNGSSLGSVRVHSVTLSYTPKSMKCDSRTSLLACTFASTCLGRELKAKVTTYMYQFSNILMSYVNMFQPVVMNWVRD
jgi:hypothetical protein